MGCGCGLLGILGIALVFLSLSIAYTRGWRNPAWDVRAYGTCQIHLRSLKYALESYRRDFGKPPARLEDLSRYVLDPATLHCPFEARGGKPYVYHPGAVGTQPLITCDNHGQGELALQGDGKVHLPAVR